MGIRDLLEDTLEQCRSKLPEHVYSKELVELVFVQPYCKIAFVVDAGIAKRQTAAEYLKELEKIGVLESCKVGRERMFVRSPAVFPICNMLQRCGDYQGGNGS